MYFDCTNYYFDINEENQFQKYRKGKDGKAKPLVGMRLFMDGNGLPIAMNIYPGNENAIKHLIPLQEKIKALNSFIYKGLRAIFLLQLSNSRL